jgi:hypothetical protein
MGWHCQDGDEYALMPGKADTTATLSLIHGQGLVTAFPLNIPAQSSAAHFALKYVQRLMTWWQFHYLAHTSTLWCWAWPLERTYALTYSKNMFHDHQRTSSVDQALLTYFSATVSVFTRVREIWGSHSRLCTFLILKMEDIFSTETSVHLYKTVWLHILEEKSLSIHNLRT